MILIHFRTTTPSTSSPDITHTYETSYSARRAASPNKKNEPKMPVIFFQLDSTVRLDEYGYVVASDALGQMIFSPIFGILADKLNKIRFVSILCGVTFCGGNIFFSLVSLLPQTISGISKPRVWSLLVARFIVGIGTGTLTLKLHLFF